MPTKKTPKNPTPTVDNSKTIQNCSFYGVKWDAKATDVIQTIADGLVENAKALGSLASVLKSQNVEIHAMVHVEDGPSI